MTDALERSERLRVVAMANERLNGVGHITRLAWLQMIESTVDVWRSKHRQRMSKWTQFEVVLNFWGAVDFDAGRQLASEFTFDQAIAILLENDAVTLPWPSVGIGRDMLWDYVSGTQSVLSGQVAETGREQASQEALRLQRLAASQRRGKLDRDNIIEHELTTFLMQFPNAKNPLIAAKIYHKVKDNPLFKRSTKDSIEARLGPARKKYMKKSGFLEKP